MSGGDGLVPGQLPPGIRCGRDAAARRAAADLARWGAGGPAALAYRWALRGGEDCPIGRSYWPGEAPSPADIENEARTVSRWPAEYEAEIAVARQTLRWLVHDPAQARPAQDRPGEDRGWLEVPLADWRKAKAAGARWDREQGRWYAPRAGIAGLRWWQPLPAELPGEDRDFRPGLFVDPVPRSCWFTDTMTCLRPESGKRVHAMVARRAGQRCEACGQDGGTGLTVHERWEYREEAGVQRLRRLACLCAACHQSTHFGLVLRDRHWSDPAFGHLLAVTGLTASDGRLHVSEAVARGRQLSKRTWALDLAMLTGFGLRLSRAALRARDGAGTHPGRIG